MSTNKQALKPGTYAILFRDNWDGERDVYETLATLGDDLIWYHHENGKALIEYEGDEVLKAWPLDDGGNLLALLDELEAAEKRNAELEDLLASEIKSWMQRYDSANNRREAAEKRIAELSASHSKLHEGMAAIYNAIRADGASTSLSAILTFVKRAFEESKASAGITVKGE
ncbi:ead/Ea22-like family protein [Escherichia coli]|nr:ead/Ea22-like family protein [Escherichia coli]